jgi:hypothetical protein
LGLVERGRFAVSWLSGAVVLRVGPPPGRNEVVAASRALTVLILDTRIVVMREREMIDFTGENNNFIKF